MSTTSMLMLPDRLADARLLEPQRMRFPNMCCPDWLAADEGESLVNYALRCAQTWVLGADASIGGQQPFVVGGVFFGGMVALEMAFHLSRLGRAPEAVLLISSCNTWDALPGSLGKRMGRLNLFPPSVRRWLLFRSTARRAAKCEKLTAEHLRLLRSMIDHSDWDWLRRSARMCDGWRRDTCDVARAPFLVHQLHGRRDRLVKPPSAKVATLLLDGGHFIVLTHAPAVNNWIEAILLEKEVARTGKRLAVNESRDR